MGLACGGTIKILIEPITKSDKCKRELLRSFYVNYREDKFSILRIDLNSNKRELLENKEALDCLLNYTKKIIILSLIRIIFIIYYHLKIKWLL